ncbi:MAG: HAD hydrolase-like protein [Planctomycetaceae bacterium]|nr:HAD hydrolase-like protein [Planctomycetaceae bacterium]
MQILLFDIDGTLLNTGGAGQRSMELALQTMFAVTRETKGVPAAGRTDRAIVSDLFAYHDIEETPEVWEMFQETYFGHLIEVLPTLPGQTLSGVDRLLATLNERDDVALGLLTGNFQRGAQLKLGHFQLDHYFGFGGFGDHHHNRDDVARAAMQAVIENQQANVDPANVWVIGDTPFDVRCGRAIGARTVAVATGSFETDELSESQPDHLFNDFSDTDSFLDLL